MDVRCEKCQTEYELDEARLKPSGVTVKCTHCGHMFKIRKRTVTNVGTKEQTVSTGTRGYATFSDTKHQTGLLRMQQAGVVISDYATLAMQLRVFQVDPPPA